jgi:hypothetical protein
VRGPGKRALEYTRRRGNVWQRRFYDFVVFSENKRVEKLRYMHRNPVQRGLVLGAPTVVVEQLSPLRLRRTRPSSGSVQPEKRSFASAKYPDPHRHRGPPVKTATGGASRSR